MQYLVYFLISLLFSACGNNNAEVIVTKIETHDFLRDIPVYTKDSLVNIVVEIPAGCNQKWEVNKQTGYLEWERINDDSLRVIRYLPYPANYGMIPRTWLPKAEGGDNDPLDVFLLGKRVERGSIVPARIIGVIRMLDNGEQDDKLIAVPDYDWHYDISTLGQLKEKQNGVADIIIIWLVNYKGPGRVKFQGLDDEIEARKILQSSINSFKLNEGIIQ
ncbi:MAG: inorganic diphosphatase [Bacteroidetes bacterium]|nr:MAG: inorganic diphosphatase [Bacteroidota bacterium]